MITMDRSSLIIVFFSLARALAGGCGGVCSSVGAGNGGLEGDGVDGSASQSGDAGVEDTGVDPMGFDAQGSGADGPLELDRGLNLERSPDWEPNLDWDPLYDWDSHSGWDPESPSHPNFDWRSDFDWFYPGFSSLSDYSHLEDWLIDLINSLEIPCEPDAERTGCWPGTDCNPDTSTCEVSR